MVNLLLALSSATSFVTTSSPFAFQPHHTSWISGRLPRPRVAVKRVVRSRGCPDPIFPKHGAIWTIRGIAERFNMTEKNRQRVQTQKSPTRAAILIPGTGSTSIDRGETLKLTLSSQGFAVREVDVVGKHDAPLQQLLSKTDTVFDIGGHTGPSLLAACEESKVAGLYVFQQSTGMFRKVLGAEESPSWIDPSIGSSYEQVLETRGWNFLSEDESEPKFAFQLTETGPWERVREQRSKEGADALATSRLGYSLKRMTDKEVSTAAISLSANQARVLLEGGTDTPGKSVDEEPETSANGGENDAQEGPADPDGAHSGVFVCALGGLPLFLPEDGLLSIDVAERSNWPGFRRPVDPDHVILREETGPLWRTEVLCARSGAHLGHVFDDSPPSDAQRFCINRSALKYLRSNAILPLESRPIHSPTAPLEDLGSFGQTLQAIELDTATFAGGCFWHVRDDMRCVPGVYGVSCGYVGRIEVVKVSFDPIVVSYESLARQFFDMHDPTTGDRQGNDWGPQYQAALFPHNADQKRLAEETITWARAKVVDARGTLRRGGDTSSTSTEVTHRNNASRTKVGRAENDIVNATRITATAATGDDEDLSPPADHSGERGNVIPSYRRSGDSQIAATETRQASVDLRYEVESGRQGDLEQRLEGTDALSGRWWEGDEILTMIVPIAEEEFIPDPNEEEAGQ